MTILNQKKFYDIIFSLPPLRCGKVKKWPKNSFSQITLFLLELATKHVLTTDRKSTIPQILIPSTTPYLVSFKRYRTFPTNFSTIRSFKLWGSGRPRNNVRSKKKFFLIVTKIPPEEAPSIFNFKKGEIMKHPNGYVK